MHGYRSKPHTPAAHLKKTAGSFGCSSPEIRTYRYWWYTYFCLLSLWFFNYHCYHHYNHYIYIYLYTSGFQATARSVTNPRWIKDIKVHVATRFDSKLKNYEISGPSYGPHCETCVGSTWPHGLIRRVQRTPDNIYIYTYIHIYIYTYIYRCVCVCLCG